jgi:uncharacterized membrane protein
MTVHLQHHPLGLAHLLTALAAIASGAAVVLSRKGTHRHRWLGRGYVAAMLAVNGTALMIYELYGRFGPFHWMSLASLATLLVGCHASRSRQPGWQYRHGFFMGGSYVGLMAALAAEIASRVPGWPFGTTVVVSSVIVVAAGVLIMLGTVPRIVGGLPGRTK